MDFFPNKKSNSLKTLVSYVQAFIKSDPHSHLQTLYLWLFSIFTIIQIFKWNLHGLQNIVQIIKRWKAIRYKQNLSFVLVLWIVSWITYPFILNVETACCAKCVFTAYGFSMLRKRFLGPRCSLQGKICGTDIREPQLCLSETFTSSSPVSTSSFLWLTF